MKRDTTRFSIRIVGSIAKKLAERDANTTCALLAYQSKLPSAVKKLKKS